MDLKKDNTEEQENNLLDKLQEELRKRFMGLIWFIDSNLYVSPKRDAGVSAAKTDTSLKAPLIMKSGSGSECIHLLRKSNKWIKWKRNLEKQAPADKAYEIKQQTYIIRRQLDVILSQSEALLVFNVFLPLIKYKKLLLLPPLLLLAVYADGESESESERAGVGGEWFIARRDEGGGMLRWGRGFVAASADV